MKRLALLFTALTPTLAGGYATAQQVCTPMEVARATLFVDAANTAMQGMVQIKSVSGSSSTVAVSTLMWIIADPSQKREMTRVLGVWLNCVHGPHSGRRQRDSDDVVVVNMESGRELARRAAGRTQVRGASQ